MHLSPYWFQTVQFDEHGDRPAGHVFILPHDRVPSSDVKDRGYVLLNRCAPPAQATLAFRSSKPTERDQFGAPAATLGTQAVSPTARSYGSRNAQQSGSSSLVYPTRLVSWPSAELTRSSESVTTLLKSIRQATSTALGIGTGTHLAAGQGHRGKLLRLSDKGAGVLPFRWGVLLTEARYSLQQRWQIVVPVFRSARKPLPNDVHVGDQSAVDATPPTWLSAINPRWTGAVLSSALVCSVSHLDGQIDRIDPATLDIGTLHALDSELITRFALA